VPALLFWPESVGDADGLPESVGVEVGDDGGGVLDDVDVGGDVAGWDGCVELGDVTGAAWCVGDCEWPAVGGTLEVGQDTEVV
jgi:hypothetical protein